MSSPSFSSREHVLVVFSVSGTREPLSTLATLVAHLQSQGINVSVLDYSSIIQIRHGQPPAWIAALFGIKIHEKSIGEMLGEKKVAFSHLRIRDLPSEFPDPPSVTTIEVHEAAVSGHLTYIRDDQVPETQFHRARINFDFINALRSYWWLRDYLEGHPEFTSVAVPNGRVAIQRAFAHAARDSGRKVLFYEIGRARNKAIYVGWHRIHDREATQKEAITATEGMSDMRALDLARDWIAMRRKPSSDINQFAKAWRRPGPSGQVHKSAKTATFFSSSADEFSALGSEWKLQEWDDQYTAFGAIASLLEKEGVQCRLRIHPNLTNKSVRHFWSEINKIRALSKAHPNLQVYWPTESVDSYELVEQSDYVVVARSTIGLEASAMGKCVWATTPTRYDLIADIRKVWTSSDVNEKALKLWNVNPVGAARFIAHLVDSDVPFSSEMMQSNQWNSSSPPFVVRLANSFIPQPVSHKFHALKIEISSQILRRLPPKLLKISSKLGG